MTTIIRTATVPFKSVQMYQLVNDIEQYPYFLPWCPQTEILSKTEQAIEAKVHIASGAFRKSFTTLNRLIPYERVEMHLVRGPFKHLEGHWLFEDLPNLGSQITLNLSFEFSNKLMAMTFGPVFQLMTGNLVQAFTARAQQLYVKSATD